jgi:Sushi repeat (SCR repeat)
VHVETREIENIVNENGNTPYGYRLKNCYVSRVFPFSVNSPRKWWAIRLFVSAPELQSVNWTVTAQTTGTKPIRRNLTINRIEYEDELVALLVLNTDVKLANLTLKADQNVSVCSAEIHTFPDQCGSPEVPIDGEVEWNTSIAIYRCKKGFQLKSGDLTRQCVDGEWAGPMPVCTEMEIEMTTDEFHWNSIENMTALSTITEDPEEIEMTTDKFYWNLNENISTNKVLGIATESTEPTILMSITPALSTITEDPWWPYLFFLALIPMAIGVIFIFRKR